MTTPYFIYSDHSYEKGGNSIKENIAATKEAGITRLGLIDYSCAAGMVEFIKGCRSANIEAILGATLPVASKERDELLWVMEHQSLITKVFDKLNITDLPVNVSFPDFVALLQSIEKGHKSKAKAKLDNFNAEVSALYSSALTVNSAEQIKELNKLTSKTKFDVEHGHVTIIADTDAGYKALLRLISIEAMNKSERIREIRDASLSDAVTWEELSQESDVSFVDTLRADSYIGALGRAKVDNNKIASFLAPHDDLTLKLGIGVVPPEFALAMHEEGLIRNPMIPFPVAVYAEAIGYEDYLIKRAVHLGDRVNSLAYLSDVTEADYMRTSDELAEIYSGQSILYRDLCVSYLSEFTQVHVTLDEYFLPDYDMDADEVIRYAVENVIEPTWSVEGLSTEEQFEKYLEETVPDDKTVDVYRKLKLSDFCMHQLSMQGVLEKLQQDHGDEYEQRLPEYVKRHKFEYEIITNMGFSGYFLIDQDVVQHAREIGVPVGDARGSGAGSLIVYGLGITDVDPIEYGLQFERFLNPERISMPDIDVDFGDGGEKDRGDMLRYISEKYQKKGSRIPSSGQIANVNRFKVKLSISHICKVHGLSQTYEKYISNLISDLEVSLGKEGDNESATFEEIYESEVFASKMNTEPMLKRVLEKAKRLYNKKQTTGVHAGGVAISPTVLTDFTAIQCGPDGNYVCQFDKEDIETAGLVKFDFLGLKTLTVLAEADRQVRRNHGVVINQRTLDKNDPKVYELINNLVLQDVFQMSSRGMRDLVKRLVPEDIGQLAVLSALFRPGALQSGMADDYVDIKRGIKPQVYDHPALEDVTKETYGCIVYQEQVMSIVRELAGYTLGEADQVRRAMGKKKIEEMMRHKRIYNRRAQEKWREDYIEKGKPLKLGFELDVCIADLEARFPALQLTDALDEGYFAGGNETLDYLASLLRVNGDDRKVLEQRINSTDYVVKDFKEHYRDRVYASVRARLVEVTEEEATETSQRVYFALSQYIRFNQIFNKIEKFASYGFNKSHAVGYALITYKTAWYKTYYSSEYYAATMTFAKMATVAELVMEAKSEMDIRLLPPDVNESDDYFKAETARTVRYGLGKIKGVGAFGKYIEEERETHGVFDSFFEFLVRSSAHAGKKIGKGVVLSLATTGALDKYIPKVIRINKEINGRSFIAWLGEIIKGSSGFAKAVSSYQNGEFENPMFEQELDVHRQLPQFSEEALDAYVISLHTPKKIQKLLGVEPGVEGVDEKLVKYGTLLQMPPQADMHSWSIECLVDAGYESTVNALKDAGRITAWGIRFVHCFNMVEQNAFFNELLNNYLVKAMSKTAVEMLNEERALSGLYLTISPLRALKAHETADREPPSSLTDGCVIKVQELDKCMDRERVLTVGIVRDIEIKRVMNEDSRNFNEKMMFFTLEDGIDRFPCKVFGTKRVNAVHNKLIEDGTIGAFTGEIEDSEKYGKGMRLTAMKAYPAKDTDKFNVLPS